MLLCLLKVHTEVYQRVRTIGEEISFSGHIVGEYATADADWPEELVDIV